MKTPEEIKAYQDNYRNVNRERLRAQQREYYKRNREWRLESSKIYQKAYEERNREGRRRDRKERYRKHKLHELSVNKKWACAHPEKMKEYRASARLRNTDKIRKSVRDSYWRHLEKRRIASRQYSRLKNWRRRSRLKAVRFDETGLKEWMKKVRSKSKATCYYCQNIVNQSEIEFDHIVPVARGGAHALDNLCVACLGCNRAKNDKLISTWIRTGQQLLRL